LKHFGLIGNPLTHSFSEQYFTGKFANLQIEATYKLFELHSLEALHDIIAYRKLDGFNVTIPYKESILPYLDIIDPVAETIGAVNCVVIRNNKLLGYNTDAIGFLQTLPDSIKLQKPNALIFGNGGSSKAVQYALHACGISFQIISRNKLNGGLTYDELDEEIIRAHPLLINTTPVGMFPDAEAHLQLPYHAISEQHVAYDLIYNPEKTTFLSLCEAQGAQIQNGYPMLIAQADAAFAYFMPEAAEG
jgi:shikimate dehydrogenase